MLKNVKLRDYQEQILDELSCVPAIGLFIKTGGGKTLTALERALRNPTQHLLVICPQKIISQWWEVIEEHTDFNPCKYKIKATAQTKNNVIQKFIKDDKSDMKVVVVNFDIIHKLDLDFVDDNWTIIVDESHKIKNCYEVDRKGKIKKGFVTYSVLKVGERTKYKIILTATPAEKKYGGYIDYYTQLRFLGYIDYNDTLFKNRYVRYEKMSIPGVPFPIPTIVGYYMDLIHDEILPMLKSCCRFYAPKYGEYEPQKIKITIDKAPNYGKLVTERVYKDINLDTSSSFRIAKKTMTSGKITGTDEFKSRFNYIDNTNKADWLEEFLSNTDDVVSVLYNYNVERDMIESVCKKLKKKYINIDGSIADKPAELKKDFDVLIGQYAAFGESLDKLQYKCHIMVFYSMPDSSEQYLQSLGRIDRIGQTEVPIYYHLTMFKTIDEKIYELLDKKIEFTTADLDKLTIKL